MKYYRISDCLVHGEACYFLHKEEDKLWKVGKTPLNVTEGDLFATPHIMRGGRIMGYIYAPEHLSDIFAPLDVTNSEPVEFADFEEARKDALQFMPVAAVQVSMAHFMDMVLKTKALPKQIKKFLDYVDERRLKWEIVDNMQEAVRNTVIRADAKDIEAIMAEPQKKPFGFAYIRMDMCRVDCGQPALFNRKGDEIIITTAPEKAKDGDVFGFVADKDRSTVFVPISKLNDYNFDGTGYGKGYFSFETARQAGVHLSEMKKKAQKTAKPRMA